MINSQPASVFLFTISRRSIDFILAFLFNEIIYKIERNEKNVLLILEHLINQSIKSELNLQITTILSLITGLLTKQ